VLIAASANPKPTRQLAVALVLLLDLAAVPSACGESEGPDPSVYARGICNHFARCTPAFVRSTFGDVPTCVAAFVKEASRIFETPGVRITKRELDACIVKTESAACDVEIETIAECDFKGTLADGAPCSSGVACASGSCLKPSAGASNEGASCGACARRAAVNESCEGGACGPGLDCVEGQCRAPAAIGDACSADAEHFCQARLACVNGTCVVPRGRDEACDGVVPCDATQGLVCVAATCTALLAKPGMSCTQTPYCEASSCVDTACQPLLTEGEACNERTAACAFPLECQGARCTPGPTCR
jgi:hypothetical protein